MFARFLAGVVEPAFQCPKQNACYESALARAGDTCNAGEYAEGELDVDIFEIIFATKQQRIIAKVLVKAMRDNRNSFTKTEMSFLATQLHDGKYVTEIDEPEFKGKKVKLS